MSDDKKESPAYLLGVALLSVFVVWAMYAATVMLCLATLHKSYDAVPALSYGNSLTVVLLLSVVGGMLRGPRSSK